MSAPPDARATEPPQARGRMFPALLLGVTATVFALGLPGGFVWDDHALLVGNARVLAPPSLSSLFVGDLFDGARGAEGATFYRPVALALWAAVARVAGPSALAFRALNLALHLGCVALALRWIRARVGAAAPPWAAVVGAAWFALHPSRAESVAWPSGVFDPLATLFALVALLAWDAPRRRPVVVALALALAALSKEVALAAAVALALEGLLAPRDGTARRDALVALAATGAALALRVAVGVRPPPARLPDAPARVVSALGHLAAMVPFPWPGSVIPVSPDGELAPPVATWSVALGAACLALGVACVIALRRARATGAARDALLSLGAAAASATVAALPVSTMTSSRYLYLPMLGVGALLARAAASPAPRARGVALGALALLGAMLPLTVARVERLQSDAALWAWETEARPSSAAAWEQRVRTAERDGELRDAARFAAEAMGPVQRAGAVNVRARVLTSAAFAAMRGLRDDAEAELQAIHALLGAALAGRAAVAALPTYGVALSIAPMTSPLSQGARDALRHARAVARVRCGDPEGALPELDALARGGEVAQDARRSAVLTAAQSGRHAEAVARCGPALRGDPGDRGLASLCALASRYAADEASLGDPVLDGVRAAQRAASFGARGLATRRLRALQSASPDRAEPALALAEILRAAGAVDAARETLRAFLARREDPSVRAALRALPR